MKLQAKNYWKKFKIKKKYCPNTSIHRILGHFNFQYKNKKILEVGFFSGSDLEEFERRGSRIFGLDINDEIFKKEYNKKKNFVKQDSGKEKIPFTGKFDLIYSVDFIYYLTDEEIKFHFSEASRKLKKYGLLLVHFIENEFELKETKKKINFKYLKISNNYINKKISEISNPVRFLQSKYLLKCARQAGLFKIGEKFCLETFGITEKKIKCYKYILFKNVN